MPRRWLFADSRYRDKNFKRGFYPVDMKLDAVRRVTSDEGPRPVAADLGVKSADSVCNLAQNLHRRWRARAGAEKRSAQ